jgi:hypothetical protein
MAIIVGANVITFPDASTLGTGNVSAFPSGTLMVFQQTAAPTGWTKQTTHNDKALRAVTGTASSGGNIAFTTALGTPSVTVGSTTLSINQIPAHTHTYSSMNTGGDRGHNTSEASPLSNSISTKNTSSAGGGGSHDHNATSAINVQYVDVIIASQN